MSIRVAIFISGSGTNMQALVEDMARGSFGAYPALVLADHARAKGLDFARNNNIQTSVICPQDFACRTSWAEAINTTVERHRIDLICLAGFMRILPIEFTQKWQGRCLNIHPSLLPKYPGLNTHQRAIQNRDTLAGATVHLVTEHLDAGPIIDQITVPIKPDDTAKDLAKRVLKAEHTLYPRALRQFISTRAASSARSSDQ